MITAVTLFQGVDAYDCLTKFFCLTGLSIRGKIDIKGNVITYCNVIRHIPDPNDIFVNFTIKTPFLVDIRIGNLDHGIAWAIPCK
ncbi:hypothetical protein H8B06_19955 [Sphingobacterium sp. DN00404]|uniref:Uncharacterized protein n=1 Tax=Sphingobacterium micropteri TaxID=2763501 RepID=A0ABR7YUT6_9SPHI|nr:hypothetical protein [Sphingobacterium micropteri]MBD1435104.1 hypothetical protein [Sphingobacterium micropteri]